MSTAYRATLRPFTPSREAPEALVERTVGRHDLLASVHDRLRSAATSKNRSHTLVVGARGSGKTHLIEVALDRLRCDPDLADRLAVARVDEDAVGIVTYTDLLLQVLVALGPPTAVLDRGQANRDVAAIETAIMGELDGRVLVAVVENLSRVFENLGTPGQRDFRSFVETSGQVVLLASTPLLFRAVGSRDEPWFGSFAVEHLRELTLDEGAELLRRLAAQDQDRRFVEFIDSPRGRARLAALHHLAGGSPRLWMILAGCADVELLDDLVPAVEALLEKLVPYYQQRLWELPGNEQKLVRQLGTGPPSMTVVDLAASCGLEERTAATALGRLLETGWVRREKVAGTDQRKSWYRLREPLLRHHFQYRQTDGEPLRLIVDILRLWFDPAERQAHLANARPASVAERHLLATLSVDPLRRSDEPYAERNIDRLLAEARSWMVDSDAIGTRDAGVLVEAAVTALRMGSAEARRVLEERKASSSVRHRAEQMLALVEAQSSEQLIEDRAGTLLDAAAAASEEGPDHRVLELVAACWNGAASPTTALQRLEVIQGNPGPDRIALTIRDERAFWLGQAGRHDEALASFSAVVEDRTRALGPDHPDILSSRHSLAYELGQAGRHDEALAAFSAVVEDRTRALGPDHPDTLTARHNLGYELGEVGRHDEAGAAITAVVQDLTRVLGADHPHTLTARDEQAFWLGQVGRHDDALAAFTAVVEDRTRVLAPDHPDTIAARDDLAWELGQLGRHDDALAAFTAVVEDRTRVLAPDHPDTIAARHALAYELGQVGRHDDALAAFTAVVEDRTRVLGPDHPSTLGSRSQVAWELGEVGRHDDALAAFTAVVEDRTRVLGPDHLHTLTSRHNQAYELGQAGRHDEAIEVAVRNFESGGAGTGDRNQGSDDSVHLIAVLVGALAAGRSLPPVDRLGSFAASKAFAVLRDMEAAKDGSPEAAARLPVELRSLVRRPARAEAGEG